MLEQVEEEEECAEERNHEVDEGEDEEQAMEAILDLDQHEEGDNVADTSNDADRGDVAFAETLDDKYCWVITEILTAPLRDFHHWNALTSSFISTTLLIFDCNVLEEVGGAAQPNRPRLIVEKAGETERNPWDAEKILSTGLVDSHS